MEHTQLRTASWNLKIFKIKNKILPIHNNSYFAIIFMRILNFFLWTASGINIGALISKGEINHQKKKEKTNKVEFSQQSSFPRLNLMFNFPIQRASTQLLISVLSSSQTQGIQGFKWQKIKWWPIILACQIWCQGETKETEVDQNVVVNTMSVWLDKWMPNRLLSII